MDLVQDYRVLAGVLPVPEKFTIGSIDPRNPRDHWHRLLRAFALRKFVSASDHVTVVRVVQSLDHLMPERNEQIRAEMQELVSQATRGVGAFGDGADGGYDRADGITRDVLYGRYLHGDYDRWARSRARPQLFEEMALWSWVTNVEQLVFSIERAILGLHDEGTIILPEAPRT